MKKTAALILALLLALCALPALAEADDTIAQISDGETRDFDGDGSEETLAFWTCEPDEYDEINEFSIAIGDQSFYVDDAWALSGEIYALNLGRGTYYNPDLCWGTLFLVSEYGPSDDPCSYCYLYADGQLCDVGYIPALPENMTADSNGRITTRIRASRIGTWTRDADYQLAGGIRYDEDYNYTSMYRICETPRDIYSMGMIVTLTRDLNLKISRYDDEPGVTLEAGQDVILAASDDVRWLYVTDMEGWGGWIEIGLDEDEWDCAIIDGEYVSVDEVFDNIWYAD